MEYLSYAVNLDAVATIETLDSGDTRLAMKHGSTEPAAAATTACWPGRSQRRNSAPPRAFMQASVTPAQPRPSTIALPDRRMRVRANAD